MKSKKFVCILLVIICLFSITNNVFADSENIEDLEKYKTECSEKGQFEHKELEIETGWWSGEFKASTIDIYTPYNYNENLKYNFILLLADDDILTTESNELNKNIFDWLIYENKCDPFILAEIPIPTKYDETTIRTYAYNIRNYYLKYVSDNYNVYANGIGLDGWIKGRDYNAVIGIKNGSFFAYNSCMVWNRDIFGSYYVSDSGDRLNAKKIATFTNSDELYTINKLSVDNSKTNKSLENTKNMYKILKKRCKDLNVNLYTIDENDLYLRLYTAIPTLFNKSPNIITDLINVLKKEAEHAHIYKDNQCIICGRNPIIWKDDLPRRYFTDCPHQGTVTEISYETKDHWKENSKPFTKHALVYLPYDYNSNKQYDVLILLHGHTLNRTAIMNKVTTFDYGVKSTFRNMFDWVFYDKLTPSKIIVTLDTPLESDHKFRDMGYELRYDVLPTLANNFATYAKDGTEEELIKARDHFGLGGSSNGAGYTHGGGLYFNMDMFGSILLMSGGMNQRRQVNDILKYENVKLNCFVRVGGTEDKLYEEIVNGFNYVVRKVDYLEKDKNAYLFDLTAGHNGRVSYTGLVNALQILFPPMNTESEIQN